MGTQTRERLLILGIGNLLLADEGVGVHAAQALMKKELPEGVAVMDIGAAILEALPVARSGATVAICTTTEGNLGDGLFPLRDYLDGAGRWGVGSDSHISVSPVEELRWLEYGQRLASHHRNIAVQTESGSVGETLLRHAMTSGAASSGHPIGTLAPGEHADYLVLDGDAPQFAGVQPEDAIDRWIFSGNRNLVRDVFVGGKQVVSEGRHRDRDAIAARYRDAMRTLARAGLAARITGDGFVVSHRPMPGEPPGDGACVLILERALTSRATRCSRRWRRTACRCCCTAR